MGADWFRHTEWDPSIELAFNAKLARARRKAQYLRIQAGTLAPTCPEVALRLLDRYFSLPDDIDRAQAHVDQATALLALGREKEALSAYEAALVREAESPRLQTQAYLELPFLVAIQGISENYARAMDLLLLHKSRLMFPIDFFRWHTAHAFICKELGDVEAANESARLARQAASQDHSGFRYHPTVGLVSSRYDEIRERLERLHC